MATYPKYCYKTTKKGTKVKIISMFQCWQQYTRFPEDFSYWSQHFDNTLYTITYTKVP
jgi:hypothetical protein